MHEAQVLMYELQAYPTEEVLIHRGDHIQSFKTASDLMQHVGYLKSYFQKLEMAIKMKAEYTGVPDNQYSVFHTFKATEDMKFLMHNIVPELVKKELNYSDIFVAVYPQVVKSKEGYDVAGFVVTRPFTVHQARDYGEKLRGFNERARLDASGNLHYTAQSLMQCRYCGGITNDVDVDYLVGTDHLSCVLQSPN
jgi:hypothetical protein